MDQSKGGGGGGGGGQQLDDGGWRREGVKNENGIVNSTVENISSKTPEK